MRKISEKLTTKERILEEAERLFAEKGLDGTSMRDITDAAGVNLASVNYHFGSKEGLIAEVFHRYLAPLNEARLAMLDTVMKEAGNSPPTLEAILEAFIRPAVMCELFPRCNRDVFLRLMGRCLSEPAAYAEKHIRPHFIPVVQRFNAAFNQAVPGMSTDETFWRMVFMAGALHYAMHMWSRGDRTPVKLDKPMEAEGLVKRLISFAAHGWRSQVPDEAGEEFIGEDAHSLRCAATDPCEA